MKADKKSIAIFIVSALIALLASSCGYESQPPQSTGGSSNYVLPAGERPSEQELETVLNAREEYNEYINQNK